MRRRWAIRVGVALVGGFMLNVLVAWGIAIVLPKPDIAMAQPTSEQGYVRSVPATLGQPTRAFVVRHAGASYWQILWEGPDHHGFRIDMGVAHIIRHGFPFVALETREMDFGQGGSFNYEGPQMQGHLPMPPGRDWFISQWPTGTYFADFLPWLPLWEGLIANTLFYAGLVLLTWLGLGRWRRRRRVRRGLCAECAYELAGLVDCPECGQGGSADAEPRISGGGSVQHASS